MAAGTSRAGRVDSVPRFTSVRARWCQCASFVPRWFDHRRQIAERLCSGQLASMSHGTRTAARRRNGCSSRPRRSTATRPRHRGGPRRRHMRLRARNLLVDKRLQPVGRAAKLIQPSHETTKSRPCRCVQCHSDRTRYLLTAHSEPGDRHPLDAPERLHNQVAGNATAQLFRSTQRVGADRGGTRDGPAKGGGVPTLHGTGQFLRGRHRPATREDHSLNCLSHHSKSPLTTEEFIGRAHANRDGERCGVPAISVAAKPRGCDQDGLTWGTRRRHPQGWRLRRCLTKDAARPRTADRYQGVSSRSFLSARRWACPLCTSLTHSQPGLADGPIRGSLGTWPSRKASTYDRSWSIRARSSAAPPTDP
jgi:hypothetical protein